MQDTQQQQQQQQQASAFPAAVQALFQRPTSNAPPASSSAQHSSPRPPVRPVVPVQAVPTRPVQPPPQWQVCYDTFHGRVHLPWLLRVCTSRSDASHVKLSGPMRHTNEDFFLIQRGRSMKEGLFCPFRLLVRGPTSRQRAFLRRMQCNRHRRRCQHTAACRGYPPRRATAPRLQRCHSSGKPHYRPAARYAAAMLCPTLAHLPRKLSSFPLHVYRGSVHVDFRTICCSSYCTAPGR